MNLLHPLFQKKYLNEILSNIKEENYSEELAFEQILITDNHGAAVKEPIEAWHCCHHQPSIGLRKPTLKGDMIIDNSETYSQTPKG